MTKKIVKTKRMERPQPEQPKVEPKPAEPEPLGCRVDLTRRHLKIECTRPPTREEAKRIGVTLNGIALAKGDPTSTAPARAELSGVGGGRRRALRSK